MVHISLIVGIVSATVGGFLLLYDLSIVNQDIQLENRVCSHPGSSCPVIIPDFFWNEYFTAGLFFVVVGIGLLVMNLVFRQWLEVKSWL